jgi:endonuclease/exonuclease/phosphatase (EEP) superfamily protein YafD
MFSRLIAWLAGLVATAILVVAFWPELVGYQRVWPFAAVVSMRGLVSLLAIIAIFILLVIGRIGHWLRRTTATLSVLLTIFVAANAWVLFTHGFENPDLVVEEKDDITVMTWNTMGGSPAPLAIANLAIASDADIIALPETSRQTAIEVKGMLDAAGKQMTLLTNAFDEVFTAHSTALLISSELGEYSLALDVGDTSSAPSLVALPVSESGPVIVAAHASAPGPGLMETWRRDIAWLADLCNEPNVIVAGDLNGNLDNFAGTGTGDLGACTDVAQVMNAAALGTWPTWVPAFAGAQIDHVMYNGPYVATEFHVYDNPAGSRADHRPIVARITISEK